VDGSGVLRVPLLVRGVQASARGIHGNTNAKKEATMRKALFNKYLWNVLHHKQMVAEYMQRVTSELMQRAVLHDYSKFETQEFDAYADNLPYFEKAAYGSEEYRAALARIKPAIDHHFAANRHHPEHFISGIEGMNLIDALEMVCDWMAAAKRVPGGKLQLERQKERFGIDHQLYSLILHTVEYLESKESE
jgi:hypothetical protein